MILVLSKCYLFVMCGLEWLMGGKIIGVVILCVLFVLKSFFASVNANSSAVFGSREVTTSSLMMM